MKVWHTNILSLGPAHSQLNMDASRQQSSVIERLLDPIAVAKLLGVSRQTVYRMIDDRQIRFCKIRGLLRIRESDVARFLDESSFEAITEV